VFSDQLLQRFDLNGPRYTSYPTADRFSVAFTADHQEQALARPRSESLSLYVHVPFCQSLCHYCACNKIISKNQSVADEYLDLVEAEARLVAKSLKRLPVVQLALGGGTPNFLSNVQMRRLLGILRQSFDFAGDREQSVEVDPRYLQPGYLAMLAELGFNRVSLGVQDFDERVQKLIHRDQSFEQTRAAVRETRDAGIRSLSFDLVYGLPIQSRETFAATLERVLALDPDRLALFNYAHLPERFKAQRRIPSEALPTIQQRTELFLYASERLVEAGYDMIGLDHFAKPGDALAQALRDGSLRRNFQGYGTYGRTDLVGLGLSAISQIGDAYSQNSPQRDVYRERILSGSLATVRGVQLSADDRVRGAVIEQIMCHGAVDWRAIAAEHAINVQDYFAAEWRRLQELADIGIVEHSPDRLHIPDSARLLLRAVAMVFDAGLAKAAPPNGVRYSPVA
jgi:oxygen-independent coproporphyrinogen-3 oxidase